MGFERVFRPWMLGAAIAIVAFLAYIAFPILSPALFNSPDDHANALFARAFQANGTLRIPEPLQILAEGHLAPRSARALGAAIVPVGFVGLPVLYGILSYPLPLLLPFLTPFFAALAAFFLFLRISQRFGTPSGVLASVFFAFHPAVWYYASRGLFPHLPFVLCLLFALIVLTSSALRKWHLVLGGFLVGLALFIRPVEVFWVVPLFFVGLSALRFRYFLWALAGLGLGSMWVFPMNALTYGGSLETGYAAAQAAQGFSYLFPFGFHPRTMLRNAFDYGIRLFPFAFALFALGVGIVVRAGRQVRAVRFVLAVVALLFVWLLSWYGSWQVADQLTLGASIGTSLARYALPLFAVASLLAGVGIGKLLAPRSLRLRITVTLVLSVLYALTSFHAVYFASPDSLGPVLQSLRRYETIKADVLSRVPSHAVMVTDATDKIFYPDRRVMTGLGNSGTIEVAAKLLETVPVYYFGITLPDLNMGYVRARLPENVELMPIAHYAHETLYQFVIRPYGKP